MAGKRPVDQITYADLAEVAGVHWTTVRRHLGSKQEMRALLANKQEQLGLINKDTRTRILDAAMRVFAKYGYAEATLDHVAADAGLTKGAVYWHFSNKSELYLTLCERSLSRNSKLIPQHVEGILGSNNPPNALGAWIMDQFQECKTNPESFMLFFEFLTSSRDPDIKRKLHETFDQWYRQIGDMLTAYQENDMLRKDVDPMSMAVFIQSLLNGLHMAWLINPAGVQSERFVDDISRILWRSLEQDK
ncbi:TetR/AcrR family transcriptional regulator [Brevibacillus porteri]|uniref:TetR/AcrR family transcriptional regulator n=1 Tax=Brevibacillus porteri TaxID=2126350 RepID=UPI003D1B96B9